MTPSFADLNLGVALPGISLALGAIILLLVDLFVKRKEVTAWLTIAGLVVSLIITLLVYNEQQEAFMGMFVADPFSAFLNIVILLAAIISVLMSIDYIKRAGIERGEYYILLLFTTVGGMFMANSNDLIAVFVSLELLSIPLYVLAAFRTPNLKSEESGMKYFILGAFSSAFFVYGAALIYGATGTTNLPQVFAAINTAIAGQGGQSTLLLLLGSGLVLVGLGFKVAVVPFHMWTPDVYEGAPTPVTAFMSVAAKVGGFAALLRILLVALPALMVGQQTVAAWQNVLEIIAAATLILGNFVAISQTNIKRLLAYSSIAHAGYILIALAAAGTPGIADQAARAALLYLIAYMFTNLGAFAVVIAVEKDDGGGTSLDDFKGLGKSRPGLAAMMAFFMLSLTGIPLTGGFIGKWFVFWAALNGGLTVLAVIGVLTSVVSAFYYVRVIVNMYLSDDAGDPAVGATPYVTWATYIGFAGTLLIGVAPFLITSLSDRVSFLAGIIH